MSPSFLSVFLLGLCLDFALATNVVPPGSPATCQLSHSFALRSSTNPNGLALDANQLHPTLNWFSVGSNANLWRFECAGGPGVYNIITGSKTWVNYALDVDSNNNVILSPRDGNNINQLWRLNHDGTLFNHGALGFIASKGAEDVAGDPLQISNVAENAVQFLPEIK